MNDALQGTRSIERMYTEHSRCPRLSRRGFTGSKEFILSFLNLGRCWVFDMSTDRPRESEWIFHVSVAVSPKLIREWHSHFAAGGHSLRKNGVSIRNIQVQRERPVSFRYGRRPVFRKGIIEHQVGIADAHVSMHELARLSGRYGNLYRIECALQEIKVLDRSVHSEMRRQRVKAFGNGTVCFRHSVSIISRVAPPGKQDARFLRSGSISPSFRFRQSFIARRTPNR